jgi:tetratricopeptide (TPR) repeat protein
VSAQDEGDLDFFLKLKDNIGTRIEEHPRREYDDLRMRYYGTLAQAEMWGVCLNLNGYDRLRAKKYAEKALETAKRIAFSVPDDADATKIDEVESNVQQDMNYLHLGYALFEPGTDGERNQCRIAEEHLLSLSEHSRRKNRMFLQRQKSLALLNGWQKSRVIPDRELVEDAKAPIDSGGWLIAANRSHLGTLYAAIGDFEEAKRLFQEGEAALSFDKCFSPVLASIRFILLVRAACSLRMKDSATAEGYYQKAEEVKVKFGESKLFKLMNAEFLISVAQTEADSRNLPQFYY